MSGAAAAEVTLSGSANAGIRDTGLDPFLHYEVNLDFEMSGSTDNGLTFGAEFSHEFDSATFPDEATFRTTNAFTNPTIFISGTSGTLTIGGTDPMADDIGLADIGFDGIGVDNDLEDLRYGDSEANIRYVYEAVGFTFGISTYLGQDDAVTVGQEGDIGILVGYEMDGFGGTVAFDRDDSENLEQITLRLDYSTDTYAVGLLYTDGDRGDAFGIDGSYTMDALTITAAYSNCCDYNDFGIGAQGNRFWPKLLRYW